MSEDLKPCPCCGNKPRKVVYEREANLLLLKLRPKISVSCSCGLYAPNIAAWNRRADEMLEERENHE